MPKVRCATQCILFHSLFENSTDCVSMLPALRKGETITCRDDLQNPTSVTVLFFQQLLTLITMKWDPFCYGCCTNVYPPGCTIHLVMTFPCSCWQMNVTIQQIGLGTKMWLSGCERISIISPAILTYLSGEGDESPLKIPCRYSRFVLAPQTCCGHG